MMRVGADLRVRPQNRLRSGEDRRTHRSAPTKGYTYHRYTSSASVPIKARRVTRCRDARSERPLYQKLQHRSFNDNGRTDRASLQRVTRHVLTQQYKWIETKQISSQIGTFVAFRSEHLRHFNRNICGVSIGTFVVRYRRCRYAHTRRKNGEEQRSKVASCSFQKRFVTLPLELETKGSMLPFHLD